MTFQSGQEVVCINDDWGSPVHGETFPVKGTTYTIREICGCPFCDGGLLLVEVVNPKHFYGAIPMPIEAVWDRRHFRPVAKTDISVFTHMLKRTPKKETVDV